MPDENPFDHVVDDTAAREESAGWAVDQIASGRTVEEVVADLAAGGWPQDDAEQIGETARQRTAGLRNAMHRSDVAGAYGAGDPNVMRAATPFANPGMFGALGGLCRAIGRLWRTKDAGKRRR
jgi:hypothetical protein